MKDYFSNINIIDGFLKEELKDVIIIPVLTSEIAYNSTTFYSNFAYKSDKDFYSNFMINKDNTNDNYLTELKVVTDNKNKELAKSKLKHSIIKNMTYKNTIKTRKDAEYYFNTIIDDKYKLNDKIVYYLDFVNEYNLLTDVTDVTDNTDVTDKELIKNAVYALKKDISNPNDKLFKLAIDTYLGPTIFLNYNLIDIVVFCGIIILTILIYVLKNIINIYLIGILLLLFLVCIVFLTVIFI